MRTLTVRAATVAAFALAALADAGAATYAITTPVRPGAAATTLWDVNNAAVGVGYSNASADGPAEAFTYAAGVFTALPSPGPGTYSVNALGISDGGTIVGSYASATYDASTSSWTLGHQVGFVYAGGSYSVLAHPVATDTYLRHISPDGRYISGYYGNDTTTGQGFVYDTTTTTFTLIGAGGDDLTIPQGINASYMLVGSDVISAANRPGFTYDIGTGTRTDVSFAGAQRTAFRDIDDAGVISGWTRDGGGATHGFTGYPGALTMLDVGVGVDTFVEGSNNAGWLVGNTIDASGQWAAFVARPVPEPSTLALALAGLGLLAARRRRAGATN